MLTVKQRVRLWLGLDYQCRCGATGPKKCQANHERFHETIREWMTPPTAAEMQAAKLAGASSQTEEPDQ